MFPCLSDLNWRTCLTVKSVICPSYDAKNKLLDKLELCEIENHMPHQLFRLIWAVIRLDILVDFTQGQHLE